MAETEGFTPDEARLLFQDIDEEWKQIRVSAAQRTLDSLADAPEEVKQNPAFKTLVDMMTRVVGTGEWSKEDEQAYLNEFCAGTTLEE